MNNMLILGKSTAHILALKRKLEEAYEMTDLGEACWILNIGVGQEWQNMIPDCLS